MEIPQLGLREVIREGSTGEVLAAGPGHRRDTAMPGQAGSSVLLGRQAGFGGPFGSIGQLRTGRPSPSPPARAGTPSGWSPSAGRATRCRPRSRRARAGWCWSPRTARCTRRPVCCWWTPT
ncbi:sortase [Kitasatospora gansuensis]